MKDSFSYRAVRTPRPGRSRLLIATFLVIALIGVDALFHGAIRNKVRVGAVLASGWAAQVWDAVGGKGERIDGLGQMEERAAAYEAIKQENDELRALLSVVPSGGGADPKMGITAPVVSSMRASPYGTFIIGAGSADGIVAGSIVLTSTGFVVGVVGESDLHTTIVREVFAPGAEVDIILRDAPGVARGFGGGNARITIPRGLTVAPGDPITVPGFGQRPVGVVGKVSSSSSASASEEVYVRLPVNLSALSFVYVIPLVY